MDWFSRHCEKVLLRRPVKPTRCHSRVGGNPEKKVYIQQIFEIKSSIYLAL
ncbi:MAG: hypothetical protein ACEY3D_06575 [Rickettsia sp.]|uniref:hypothetical protein n=1 Tax=Rickettsia sp. TaxID=789 RepID=UPI00397D56DB